MPTTPTIRFFYAVPVFLLACGGVLGLRSLLFGANLTAGHRAEPTLPSADLTIYYHERRPYYFADGDRVGGLVVENAAKALENAGIPFRWAPLPPARQLQLIKTNAVACGAIGWFATEERLRFAQFTDTIYQDEPFVALTRIDNPRLRAGMSVVDVLKDPDLTLLVKDAYSYGGTLDQLMTELQPRSTRTPVDNAAMVRMVGAGRADYFFVAPEEARELLAPDSPAYTAFHVVELAGIPRGATRHLMFSRAVSPAIIDRLNDALRRAAPTAIGGEP
ncbi:MAG: transporter substrate-binding domain-containing protein [Candidatus Didemnitutus sp.]|nr:transporter substrate-binding domain-containing protein [Candidatus Didemnitutus sp.]